MYFRSLGLAQLRSEIKQGVILCNAILHVSQELGINTVKE